MANATQQYLAHHAQPESLAALKFIGVYRGIVVVPAYRESIQLMTGLAPVLANQGLAIIVVNRGIGDNSAKDDNQQLIAALHLMAIPPIQSLADNVEFIRTILGDIIVIDKTSPSREQPSGGVGLARRIGLDLALALSVRGHCVSSWLHTTDADAQLPSDYLHATNHVHKDTVALTYPYRHQLNEDADSSQALMLYELSLRYYLLGLRWAGSPFAFSAIGSTMAIHGDAYAQVRGVPTRTAGEDFYLLAKLAKLGRIERPQTNPIQLNGIRQVRTPFGTAVAVRRIRDQCEPFTLYQPKLFAILKRWLSALENVAQANDLAPTKKLFADPFLGPSLLALGCERGIAKAIEMPGHQIHRRRRLHQFFDAKRTLRLIHLLRDHSHPNIPWMKALVAAPFIAMDTSSSAQPTASNALKNLIQSEESTDSFSGIDTLTDYI